MTTPLTQTPLRPTAQLSAQSAALIKNGPGRLTAESKNAAQKAAQDFETTFLNTLLQGMFEGVKLEEPFGGGYGEDVYRSMMVEEYAKTLASSGGIGLADEVYREMLAQQEGQNQ